jgi:electron transfer flavoprotein alpha subunit
VGRLARTAGTEDDVRAIVLVKQVPDVRDEPVGVRPDGTIDRAGAPAITNPADLHALEAALCLAEEVWALSMGPPTAEATLREAVSLGASRAFLLCDRMLAGSDTWATANALAAAIGRLEADLVLCGISAIDGETGQVGPEVATRLGWPQATGCESLERDGSAVVARRIVEGGFERLRVPLPAVVTVAETGFSPRYPSVMGRRRATAATIERLGADELGLDASTVGLGASPTKVAQMRAAPLPERSCQFVGAGGLTYDGLARALDDLGALADSVDIAPVGEGSEPSPVEALEAFPGDPNVWVVCELHDGLPARVSLELLSKATALAPALGGGVAAIVAGSDLAPAVDEVVRHGADVVIVADDEALVPYRAEPHARVLTGLLAARRPAAVLFGATTTGRDLAPRVAAELGTGLAADCTDLTVAPWHRRGVQYDALLHQIRPAMAGGVLATCVCPDARPQMATVRPGVFELRAAPRRSRIEEVPVTLLPVDLRVEVLDRQTRSADVGLEGADVVIAGGAGCDSTSWHLIDELAEVIGGRVAASRGAVEAGLAPRAVQVGQTGMTVHPRLYVACGISGALQHTVGMRTARTVVAINRDPEAFIFRLAHFGIVADVRDALPLLTAALRRSDHGEPTSD